MVVHTHTLDTARAPVKCLRDGVMSRGLKAAGSPALAPVMRSRKWKLPRIVLVLVLLCVTMVVFFAHRVVVPSLWLRRAKFFFSTSSSSSSSSSFSFSPGAAALAAAAADDAEQDHGLPCDRRRTVRLLERSGFHSDHSTVDSLCIRHDAGPADKKNTFTIGMIGHNPTRARANYRKMMEEFTRFRGSNANVIDSIVFVWNNQDHPVPRDAFGVHKHVLKKTNGTINREFDLPHLVVLRAKSNSLNNRWRVAPFIRTDATLTIDDDVLVQQALMLCIFNTWRLDTRRIVGVKKDLRTVSKEEGRYKSAIELSEAQLSSEYTANVVLTKTMMLATKYFYEFMADERMMETVDERRNCEDIAMNALVNKLVWDVGEGEKDAMGAGAEEDKGGGDGVARARLHEEGRGPLYVMPNCVSCRRRELDDTGGLSLVDIAVTKNWTAWHDKRSDCVRWLKNHLGEFAAFPSRHKTKGRRCWDVYFTFKLKIYRP